MKKGKKKKVKAPQLKAFTFMVPITVHLNENIKLTELAAIAFKLGYKLDIQSKPKKPTIYGC